ncbi:MAG: ABC transporter substrate-binding protein [Rhodobacteraceae bacterium]|jgi:phospholipid transport system substrate-binding protein|nr:ABC transporter substrate-binding protein [Paracoccaceae bacterium]
MATDLTRRAVMALAATGALAARPAAAMTEAEASALISEATGEITRIINSGQPEGQMLASFRQVFLRYSDLDTIARFTLGPTARSASAADMRAYTDAFAGYIARKYGRRFREFIGGSVTVTGTSPSQNGADVSTVANLRGTTPFEVVFRVSDRSGRPLFYDLVVEGISLLKAEQTEVGALLDRSRGSIAGLVQALDAA